MRNNCANIFSNKNGIFSNRKCILADSKRIFLTQRRSAPASVENDADQNFMKNPSGFGEGVFHYHSLGIRLQSGVHQ